MTNFSSAVNVLSLILSLQGQKNSNRLNLHQVQFLYKGLLVDENKFFDLLRYQSNSTEAADLSICQLCRHTLETPLQNLDFIWHSDTMNWAIAFFFGLFFGSILVSGIGILPEETGKLISAVSLVIGTILYNIHTCFIDLSMYKEGIKMLQPNKNSQDR